MNKRLTDTDLSNDFRTDSTDLVARRGHPSRIATRFRTRSARLPDQSQAGFTIVELMIASVVFTTILVVITIGVIRFTNGYYRGINSSSTQTTAQAAMDAISQSTQFSSGGTASGGTGYFCAGGKQFIFTPGIQYLGATPSLTNAGLYMVDHGATCPAPTAATITGGKELIGENMRVVYASITNPSTTYLSTVKLKIAYGDADLLCSPAIGGLAKGSCAKGATNYTPTDPITATDTTCKPTVGSQFCSVVEFSSTIQQRLVH